MICELYTRRRYTREPSFVLILGKQYNLVSTSRYGRHVSGLLLSVWRLKWHCKLFAWRALKFMHIALKVNSYPVLVTSWCLVTFIFQKPHLSFKYCINVTTSHQHLKVHAMPIIVRFSTSIDFYPNPDNCKLRSFTNSKANVLVWWSVKLDCQSIH